MRVNALLAGILAVGCGGSMMERHDVSTYRATATDAVDVAEEHKVRMGSVAPGEQCQAEMMRYQEAMRPMLDRMLAMGAEMDGHMRSGGMTHTDAGASCQSMASELQTHVAQGCASMDPGTMQAEADRHLQAITAMARHAEEHAGMMEGMMGGGMMGSGGMMDGGCGSH